MDSQPFDNPEPERLASGLTSQTERLHIQSVEVATNPWQPPWIAEMNRKTPMWWEIINAAPEMVSSDELTLGPVGRLSPSSDIFNDERLPDDMELLTLTRKGV